MKKRGRQVDQAAVQRVLDRAARLQARSDAWGAVDVWTEGQRRAAKALEIYDDLAARMLKVLEDESLDSVVDEDDASALEVLLRRIRKDSAWVARQYSAPKRARGAPHSWRGHFEQELTDLHMPRSERRGLLRPERLRRHWQLRKAVPGPGGVGVQPGEGQPDFLWCNNHPLGCPREERRPETLTPTVRVSEDDPPPPERLALVRRTRTVAPRRTGQ